MAKAWTISNVALLVILLMSAASLQPWQGQSVGVVVAARPVKGEERRWRVEQGGLLLQSLPQGPVPPSGPSGCTHDPNIKGGVCHH